MAKKVNPQPKRRAGAPVFLYTSVCCGVKAHKDPLVKTEDADGTLGKFRCTNCKKRCKCNRSLNKKEETVVETKTQDAVGGSDAQVGA